MTKVTEKHTISVRQGDVLILPCTVAVPTIINIVNQLFFFTRRWRRQFCLIPELCPKPCFKDVAVECPSHTNKHFSESSAEAADTSQVGRAAISTKVVNTMMPLCETGTFNLDCGWIGVAALARFFWHFNFFFKKYFKIHNERLGL